MSLLESQPLSARLEYRAASAIETALRPHPDELFADLGDFAAALKQASPAIDLHLFTGLGIAALDPNFRPHPRDFDFAVKPDDLDFLETHIPTISKGPFRYNPKHPIQREVVAQPIFPEVESQRLSFQVIWSGQPTGTASREPIPIVYDVEIFSNHDPKFINHLLPEDIRISSPAQIPVVKSGKLSSWHPWLTCLLYANLQEYESIHQMKQDRTTHRYQTMLAASHLAHRLQRQSANR